MFNRLGRGRSNDLTPSMGNRSVGARFRAVGCIPNGMHQLMSDGFGFFYYDSLCRRLCLRKGDVQICATKIVGRLQTEQSEALGRSK